MNNTKKIFLSPPHMGLNEEEYVKDAFASNWIAPLGPHVDAFEKELAQLVDIGGAVALNSGTAAIHLALKVLGVGAEDTVFCSTLTFVASANPILYVGATPVFIDSEPSTWNMSPVALEKAFIEYKNKGKLPKAVIVVNLYGQSADIDSIKELCDIYEIPIIEDAAESLGSTYKKRMSGTLGKFGIYSFNGNKIITTSGGGMLVSNDLEALDRARYLSTQARIPAKHYQHIETGYNYRLSNVLAAIGRGQLKVLNERVEKRRDIFNQYFLALSNIDGVNFMPEADYGRSNRWLTTLTLDHRECGFKPLELIEYLDGLNIESRPVWKPLHLQPLFSCCDFFRHDETKVISEDLFFSGICLPSGSSLTNKEIKFVINSILNFLEKSKKV